MLVVGFMSACSISGGLFLLLSLQHVRCRFVVSEIPIGPFLKRYGRVVHFDAMAQAALADDDDRLTPSEMD